MKKIILLLAVLPLLQCAKKSDEFPFLDNSKWIAVYFLDKDNDKTDNLSGYYFEFKPRGVFVAHLPDNKTKNGAWYLNDDDTKLQIAISGETNLDDVKNNWALTDFSAGLMKLKEADENGGEDVLHLKIF